MSKIITATEAAMHIRDGMCIMIGGFFHGGQPQALIRALDAQGTKDLTLISLDAGNERCASYGFIASGKVIHHYVSHMGRNPGAGKLMLEGKMKVTLVPQGTMAERIRAGGAGLGGILTPTGVGTEVEEGKQRITIGGKDYLLELPLKADVAFIKAHTADEKGNLVFHGTTRNMNTVMATAADVVVAEVEHIVKAGEIDPDHVHIPGLLVDYLVKGEKFHGE